MSEKEKTTTDLDAQRLHDDLYDEKLSGVNSRIMSLGDTLHQRIDDFIEKDDMEHNYIRKDLTEIKGMVKDVLEHVKKTNGRVTELEKDKVELCSKFHETIDKLDNTKETVASIDRNTRIVQFFHKYPKVSFVFAVFLYIFAIKEIRDHIFRYMESMFSLFKHVI